MAILPRTVTTRILESTGAETLSLGECVQTLWSGYGRIFRAQLNGRAGRGEAVIVKHVEPPSVRHHPRGWHSDRGHARKLRSYEVEAAWYRLHHRCCGPDCRVPRCLAAFEVDDSMVMVLEDLDAAGFPRRLTEVDRPQMDACLRWLAAFHAIFMGAKPVGVWPVGTYWHLDTRPDEWEVLEDRPLKEAACEIDRRLSAARYQSLVHGDAKLANFCFADHGNAVAAVDFQYVGGGCGMKDVAYFVGSCLHEDDCAALEGDVLDVYFQALRAALAKRHPDINANAVEHEWRGLYHLAWVDFHRFLKGWSPGHWKINGYSERLVREVLDALTPP